MFIPHPIKCPQYHYGLSNINLWFTGVFLECCSNCSSSFLVLWIMCSFSCHLLLIPNLPGKITTPQLLHLISISFCDLEECQVELQVLSILYSTINPTSVNKLLWYVIFHRQINMQESYLYRLNQSNYHILPNYEVYEKDIHELHSEVLFEGRSSQLYMKLLQLRKESLKKKFRLVQDSNPWPLRYQCSTLPVNIKLTSQLGAEVVELVGYKPVKWWNYEYIKMIYVNCRVKNFFSGFLFTTAKLRI